MADFPDERPEVPPTGGPAPSTDPKDFDNNDKRDAIEHNVDPREVTPHEDMREAEYIQKDKERTAEINRSGGLPLPEPEDEEPQEPESAAYTLIDAADGTVIGAIEAEPGATEIETEDYVLPVTMVPTQGHGMIPVVFGPRDVLERYTDKGLMVPPVWTGFNQGSFHGLAVRAMMERYVERKDADDRDEKRVTLDESYLDKQREEEERARNPGPPPVVRGRAA